MEPVETRDTDNQSDIVNDILGYTTVSILYIILQSIHSKLTDAVKIRKKKRYVNMHGLQGVKNKNKRQGLILVGDNGLFTS